MFATLLDDFKVMCTCFLYLGLAGLMINWFPSRFSE